MMFGRIINLANRLDRWERMHPFMDTNPFLKRFDAIRVTKEQALAVLDSSVKNAAFDPWPRTSSEQIKGAGAVGCYLSHLQVWKDFLESGHEHALILEDDLDPSQVSRVSPNIHWLMDKSDLWDIGLLGWVGTLYDPHKGFIGAHAYIINRNAASALVQEALPVRKQVDFLMNDLVRNKRLKMVHVPFHQRMRQSAMGESNVYTPTWLHWIYLGMALFSVAFVSFKFFEVKQRR
jgi:GR25 family glycosyltransferase involved in LPS biosynthesis